MSGEEPMKTALIVGTGVEFSTTEGEWSEIASPYGASITMVNIGDQPVAILRRHGPATNVPPHLVNYRANMLALQEMGVERVIATAAVRSMRQGLPPGSLVVLGDFIDFTKHREPTIYDRPGPKVTHTDFSTPYCPEISGALEQTAAELGIRLGKRAIYVCVDGPRYETPAEVRMFAKWGGDVVGMTESPEVVFARELGMCYATLAIVSNLAAGISEKPVSHKEVVEQVSSRQKEVRSLLERAVTLIPETRSCCATPTGESSA
jgi:5'-methylthioadenosine phosphorylase